MLGITVDMAKVAIIVGLLLIASGITIIILGVLGIPAGFASNHHVMMLCTGIAGITVGALTLWVVYFSLD